MDPAVRALCLLLVFAACERARPESRPAASESALPAPPAATPLAIARRAVQGREYLELSGPELALALERPKRDDKRVLAVVAGTYTSPEGVVEGAVVVDGRMIRAAPLPWEALLVIDDGAVSIRWLREAPSRQLLTGIAARKASALQGHLLVGDARARPLKPSPALRRRALVTRAGGAFSIVESMAALELAHFAGDLVLLGATQAMNLDMGGWSEGWYRGSDGTVARLGDDFRATDRQSNWLVIRTR